MDKLVDLDIISSLEDIDGIGHRITAGGEKYVESVVIDDKVIEDLFELKDFALYIIQLKQQQLKPLEKFYLIL